jgi:hypothetical protein
VKIDRLSLIERLDDFARDGHGLVTGVPGVGKTYSMAQLHDLWKDQGLPNQVVPVDRLGAVTDPDIRAALGIADDLVDHFVEYFRDKGRGVVVFDGFDSARNEGARDRMLSLIQRTIEAAADRWTVLVTVRIYDATRSAGLRALFRKPSIRPFKDITLGEARVFEIPKLDDSELTQATEQINGLNAVLAIATRELRDLLCIPFNLWLTRQIMMATEGATLFSAVASEVELLGLYWKRRVLASDRSMEIRHILTQVVRQMVEAYALSVRREEVFEISAAPIWTELFSAGVLEEAGTSQQRIVFSHNILFDYAVSVLLMEDEPGAMNAFIATEFSRPFFLRPSIAYYYTRLWYDDRDTFWKSVWVTIASKDSQVRLVGRIIPPSVVVREARHIADFAPVFNRIDHDREDARHFFLRLLQALTALGWSNALLWTRVCIEGATRPAREYVWNIATVATRIGEETEPVTDDIRSNLGIVGRLLLRWALSSRASADSRAAGSVGPVWAVPLVAKTFSTDGEESEALLRDVLGLLAEPGFPVEYLTRLCDSIGWLFEPSPRLAADIYRSVYGHAEMSEEVTNFGTPILPMRSTRRQDFGMCQYALAQDFEKFLDASLRIAADVALDCFSSYIIRERVEPYLYPEKRPQDLSFTLLFRGQQIEVIADHSAMWLDVAHPDDPLRLVHAVISRITRAAENGFSEWLSELLDSFAVHATVQSAWVLLLRAGTTASKTLGPYLAELAVCADFRRGAYHDVVNFVQATFSSWPETLRHTFEHDVEAMYQSAASSQHPDSEEHFADLFATAIPEGLTLSSIIAERRRELQKRNAFPANEPPVRITTSSRAFTNEDWLEEKGVDIQNHANRLVLDLANELEGLGRPWQNSRPPAEAVSPLIEKIGAARSALSEYADAAPDARELLQTQLAAAGKLVAKAEGDVSPASRAIAKDVLIEAAKVPLRFDAEWLSRQFTSPSWSPIPQTEAAQGLPWLIVWGPDGDVLDAIQALAESQEPSVRFLIAAELFRLRDNAPQEFWTVIHRMVRNERSPGVLSGVLNTLSMIRRSDAGAIAEILAALAQRDFPMGERSQFSDGYVRLLAWLGFNIEEPWAVRELSRVIEQPVVNYHTITRLAFEALSLLTPAYIADARVRPMSLRAAGWVHNLLLNAAATAPEYLRNGGPDASRALFGIADDVGSRLYFNIRRGNDDRRPAPDTLRDYYNIATPLVEDLIAFAQSAGAVLVPRTAHHVIELLHAFLPLDPVRVLHLVTEIAVAGSAAGYNLDGMAIQEVVAISEELLADYRAEIAEGDGLADFVRLLDTFAESGWPDALRLLWRLDEVFR